MLMVELTRVWRQKDETLVATLNRIRIGEARPSDVAWLNHRCAAPAKGLKSGPPAESQALGVSRNDIIPEGISLKADVAACTSDTKAISLRVRSGIPSSPNLSMQVPIPVARPMLLAPTNAVVSERNSRELQVRRCPCLHSFMKDVRARLRSHMVTCSGDGFSLNLSLIHI